MQSLPLSNDNSNKRVDTVTRWRQEQCAVVQAVYQNDSLFSAQWYSIGCRLGTVLFRYCHSWLTYLIVNCHKNWWIWNQKKINAHHIHKHWYATVRCFQKSSSRDKMECIWFQSWSWNATPIPWRNGLWLLFTFWLANRSGFFHWPFDKITVIWLAYFKIRYNFLFPKYIYM